MFQYPDCIAIFRESVYLRTRSIILATRSYYKWGSCGIKISDNPKDIKYRGLNRETPQAKTRFSLFTGRPIAAVLHVQPS